MFSLIKVFNKIYYNHIGWRKRKWNYKKYLNNYLECFEMRQLSFVFKMGHNFLYEDKISAEHVFSEIFIDECYMLKPDNKELIIIDVGANIGLFSYYAYLKCQNSRIISIEANPTNYKILNKNIQNNRLGSNIIPINSIVSSSTKQMTISVR